MTVTPGSHQAADGTRLLTRHWGPTAEPWASILLVHGLGEHSGRYEHVGEAFAAAGLDAHAFDLRGFGGSGGPRAWVRRWSDLHDDLAAILAEVRAGTTRPAVLYGHSLGALVIAGYVLSDRPRPDLLVLSAPAIDDDLARWKHLVAGPLARLVPRLRLDNGIRSPQLAADPREGMRYEDDPLVQLTSTTAFGAAAFREQARVREALRRIDRMPVTTLAFRGAEDPVVPARALATFGRLGDVTVRTYPGLRHETHNEATGGRVLDDVLAWIRERVAASGGVAASGVE